MRKTTGLTPTLLLLAVATGCGGGSDDTAAPEPADDAGAAADAATDSGAAATAPATGFPRSPSPAGARVFFVTPADGDVVASPVHVEFGVAGMEVVPAGTQAADSGHHHVIIDTDLPPMDAPIPADANHVHFGDGSTSTELELEPGEHTLQLLFADHLHVPHEPPVASEPITVTVE